MTPFHSNRFRVFILGSEEVRVPRIAQRSHPEVVEDELALSLFADPLPGDLRVCDDCHSEYLISADDCEERPEEEQALADVLPACPECLDRLAAFVGLPRVA